MTYALGYRDCHACGARQMCASPVDIEHAECGQCGQMTAAMVGASFPIGNWPEIQADVAINHAMEDAETQRWAFATRWMN